MKPRSPRFPFIPLPDALELLRKLAASQDDATNSLTRPGILKALDYASLHGAAIKTVGALRAYDLLEKAGDGVRISPVGRRILETTSGEEKAALLQRAALSPLTFRMIWRRARHSSRAEHRDLLLERGFTEPGAKRASRIYRINDEFTGLRDLELEPELPIRGEGPGRKRGECSELPESNTRKENSRPGRPRINPNSLSIPLSTGAAIIPKGISEVEFENLMVTLSTWKAQLVRKATT